MNRGYIVGVLRLTLAPEIVEAILDGRQPEGMQLEGLLVGVPPEWEAQQLCILTLSNHRSFCCRCL